MVKALKMDARVQIGIPIGGIMITGTGSNAGGPMISQGININFANGTAIIQ